MSLYVAVNLLCNSILNASKNIQAVALVNKMGKPVEKISRPRFLKQFPDYMNEIFLMHCVLQVSMGRDFDENYGPINYHISERTSLITLTFPLDDNIILVTTNKNVSPITLAKKIVSVINEHRKQSD
jgi:hypothetical protein